MLIDLQICNCKLQEREEKYALHRVIRCKKHLFRCCTGIEKEALNQADLMVKSGRINDVEAYRASVFAREEEGTTGIGEGIAIPHGRGASVSKPGPAAMVIKNGVEFESLLVARAMRGNGQVYKAGNPSAAKTTQASGRHRHLLCECL